MEKVWAPWTDAQVLLLGQYQNNSMYHPYTCPNRGDGHQWRGSDLGALVPVKDGWFCRDCDYEQDWAYEFSFTVAYDKNPFDEVPDSFWVCGYRGVAGICGKDQFCGCHTESYGPGTFDKHRFVKGMWVSSG